MKKIFPKIKLKKDKAYYQQKAKEYLFGWKLAKADFINFKRRSEQERLEFFQFAKTDFILQILPVLDNFETALKHIPQKEKNSAWVEGIMYIQKQLADILQQQGVEEIEIKKNQKFDPALMEAIEKDGKENKSEDLVKKIVSKGYKLNGKVIRPGKVVV